MLYVGGYLIVLFDWPSCDAQ